MAFLLKKSWTAPLPRGAEVVVIDGVRIAKWRLRNGEPRSAEIVEGSRPPRIRGQTACFVARYRDADGVMRERPTGCRDQRAARAVLHELERQVEKVRSGLLTAEEVEAAVHGHKRFSEHLDDHIRHLELKGGAPHRVKQVRARLERLARECGIHRLSDMTPASIERWLSQSKGNGMSASTMGGYRQVAIALANWAVKTGRLLAHRLHQLPQASSRTDRRRVRRAVTHEELTALLDAARRRPLHEALIVRRGKRKGSLDAKVRPEIRVRLEALGEERALAYRLLATTGLRVSELRSITVGQTALDAAMPHLALAARDEKSRRGATIPLRGDVVEELRRWLEGCMARARARAERLGLPVPDRLAPGTRLVAVPAIRVFDADIAFAGLAKADDRGRTLDLHSLRHSFATHLSMAGVPLRVAQAALRHSSPVLTAVIYTDERLLDVAGAIERLPCIAARPAASA